MRIRSAGPSINPEQLMQAVRAGHATILLAQLGEQFGIALDAKINGGKYAGILPRVVFDKFDSKGLSIGKTFGLQDAQMDRIAFDAQPDLVTTASAGIPAFLSNYLDPALIEVLVSPMKAAEIAGEVKKGDWVTTVATFITVESDGQVSAYGDYSNAGNADANLNFPQRQSFHYQVFTQWGEKELANAGLAGVDLASRKNIASALILNKFQNKSYFFGIAGLQNYGLLNDPSLLPAIVPTTNWNAGTSDQVFSGVLQLFAQLVSQGNGLVDQTTSMTMALSPSNAVNLSKTNQFGLNVYDLITKNYPNIKIVTAPEYSTSSGELVQLIVDNYEGQETMTAAFTEKMRAHAVVVGASNFTQKKSQGTWGTIIFRPVLVAQMLG